MPAVGVFTNWFKHNLYGGAYGGKQNYFVNLRNGLGQSTYDQIITYFLGQSSVYIDSMNLSEWHIYGSSRIGIYQTSINMAYRNVKIENSVTTQETTTTVAWPSYTLFDIQRGAKRYELSNHLGNVLAVVSDKKIQVCSSTAISYYTADFVSATDYSPFGAPLEGRSYTAPNTYYPHGYTGLMKDDEINGAGNVYGTEWREYDARVITWWSIDPLTAKYPSHSPYNYTEGNPIVFNDRTGKGKTSTIVDTKGNVVGGKIDGDKGIYMVSGVTKDNFDECKVEEYKKSGARVATSASENSFLMEDNKTWTGHINFNSTDASNKIDYATSIFTKSHSFLNGNPNAFLDYKNNANNNQDYDIKSWGLNKGASDEERIRNYYEASFGPQGLIFTNRDAGNYFAGKAAAMMGIPWSFAASGFGALNGAGNTTNGLYYRTIINLLFYNGFKADLNLQYKEDKGSFDLQKMGFESK